MIEAIWPSYANLPNTMPRASGVTTKDFVSFVLFWLLSLPALWAPIHKIRHLFTVKACYSPLMAIVFLIWTTIRAGGLGSVFYRTNTVYTSTLAWAIVRGIMQTLNNFAALIINNPDFTRFAHRSRDALWPQIITIPVGFAATSFIGIVVSSSSGAIYGQATWNPLALLHELLDRASSAERFGVFAIATGFALAQLGTNVAANSVSAGTNIAALLPRYINIRRGGYICPVISLAICPVSLFHAFFRRSKPTILSISGKLFIRLRVSTFISPHARCFSPRLPVCWLATIISFGEATLTSKNYTPRDLMAHIMGLMGFHGRRTPRTFSVSP